MADLFSVTVDGQALRAALDRLAAVAGDMRRTNKAIATELMSQTEDNFAAEGRPRWPDLAPITKARRAERGHWPGKMLQVTGQLAASVSAQGTAEYALVGAGKVYAAIHQFGGKAGRGRRVTIPARPYLPMVGSPDSAKLQAQTEQAILDIVERHLTRALET